MIFFAPFLFRIVVLNPIADCNYGNQIVFATLNGQSMLKQVSMNKVF